MSSSSDKEFQRQMRMIERETSSGGPDPYGSSGSSSYAGSSGTPHGIIALVSFLAGAGAFVFGLVMALNAFACVFFMMWTGDPGNSAGELKTGGILMAVGLLLFIVSASFGGASVISGNQTVLGWISIALSALPFLWLLASIILGTPLGLDTGGGSSPTSPEDAQAFLGNCAK